MSKLYYKGETVFLYINFQSNNVVDPKVRILHEHMGDVYEDLPWTKMSKIINGEYAAKFVIPYNCDNGIYNIFYNGITDGKKCQHIEQFHIIDKSKIYSDAIKLYGNITSSYDNLPLNDVEIQVRSCDGIYYTQSSSLFDGYWQTFVYPNSYNIIFKLDGFKTFETNFEIGFDSREINFGNVVLESNIKKLCGNGICEVSDSYILKNGIPLDGLQVNAMSIDNPTEIIAQDITNNRGEWKIFLDPGYYLLRVTGNSMNLEFNKVFRLKVTPELSFELDDMENNKIQAQDEYLSNGDGPIDYEDFIYNKQGKPIPDVQVNIFKGSTLIAECYTDMKGRYIFHLDHGKYQVSLYHPQYKELPKFSINL